MGRHICFRTGAYVIALHFPGSNTQASAQGPKAIPASMYRPYANKGSNNKLLLTNVEIRF